MKRSTSSWLPAPYFPKRAKIGRRHTLLWAGLPALLLAVAWQLLPARPLQAADALALSAPWRFVDESKPGSPPISGGLEMAEGDAPAQVAAHFELHSSMEALALQLADGKLGGVPLAEVEEMRYCTHLIDSPLPYAVTLQVNIDADVTDHDTSWQGRLVYTPADNGAVIQGEWQCWNPMAGKWWATGGPLAEIAHEGSPQPLATFQARFPHFGINAAYAVVALKAGDGWSYFEGEASPVVIGLPGEKIEVAFAGAPAAESPQQEVLLPVLLNQEPGSPPADPHGSKENKEEKKGKKEKKSDDGPDQQDQEQRLAWRSTDWAAINWAGFDWQKFDWDKVDWQHLNWGAFGWAGDDHAEAIRAFVDDVQKCKAHGWQDAGFHSAGDCVAYYIKAHAPADWDWSNFGWGRMWMERDGDDGWNDSQNWDHNGDRNEDQDNNQDDSHDYNRYRGFRDHDN